MLSLHILIPLPCFKCQVRNVGMVKANANLFVSIAQIKGHAGFTSENGHKCYSCGESHMNSRNFHKFRLEVDLTHVQILNFVAQVVLLVQST